MTKNKQALLISIVDQLANKWEISPNEITALRSEKSIRNLKKATLLEGLSAGIARLERGLAILADLDKVQPDSFKTDKIETHLSKLTSPIGTFIISEELENEIKSMTMQQMLDISNDTLIDWYQAAVALYNEKKYQDSADVLMLITFLNPTIPSFWFALGISDEACEELDRAIFAYSIFAEIHKFDTIAQLFTYVSCLRKKGDILKAEEVLLQIVKEAEMSHDTTGLKQKALYTMNEMAQKIVKK